MEVCIGELIVSLAHPILKKAPFVFCKKYAKSSAPKEELSFIITLSLPKSSTPFFIILFTNSASFINGGIPSFISIIIELLKVSPI